MKSWSTTTLVLAAVMLAGRTARADFKVWLPDVNMGELAVESVGDAGFDPHASRSDEYTAELEYGVTSWVIAHLG
jgi:hypothetical protein